MFKILLIDDNQSRHSFLKSVLLLNKKNYSLLHAYDGRKGLEITKKQNPEIIFVDINMPILNGIEYLKLVPNNIKEDSDIIVITSNPSEELIKQCYELGADMFLRHPFSPSEILSIITNAAKWRRYKLNLESITELEDILTRSINEILSEDLNHIKAFSLLMERILDKIKCDRIALVKNIIIDNTPYMQLEAERYLNNGEKKISDTLVFYDRMMPLPYHPIFSQWWEKLTKKEYIHMKFSRMPHSMKKIFSNTGIKSILIVPVFTGQTLYGYIEIDSYIEKEEEVDIFEKYIKVIRLAADFIGTYLKMKYSEFIIKENERYYRLLLGSFQDVMVSFNEKFICTYVSEHYTNMLGEQLSCYKGMHLKNWKFLNFIPNFKFEVLFSNTEEILSTKEVSISIREELRHFDVRVFANIGREIEKDSKWVFLIRDITTDKEKDKKIREQKEMLIHAERLSTIGTLISGIAHEINNPLTYMILNIALLKKSISKYFSDYSDKYIRGDKKLSANKYSTIKEIKEKMLSFVTSIEEGANRLKVIIQELKGYIRKDRKDFKVKISINKIVENAIGMLSYKLKKCTNNLSLELSESISDVMLNPLRVEQVFINILSNACDAISEVDEPRIKIITGFNKNTCEVYVKFIDNGMGIPKENLNKITQPFFTTKYDKEGTGLGLAVSKEIIEDYNGRITFDSQLGKGTTVTVLFPAAKP